MLYTCRRAAKRYAPIVFFSLAALAFGNASQASGTGSLSMGPQAMEGNLIVMPGTTLLAGYDLTIPGSHPATTVRFTAPQVAFVGHCTSGGALVMFTVPTPSQSYTVPLNNGGWFPSGDQHGSLVYQGAITVPDLCAGGSVSLAKGGTFTTQVSSDVPVPGNGVHVRWHYSANGSSGSWSGTAAVQPSIGGNGTPDLAITKNDGLTVVNEGASSSTTYTIVVTNTGTANAPAETVSDPQPTNVDSFTWTATTSGGASVDQSAGSGSISDSVTVPVGGTVTFTVAATGLHADSSGLLVNTATVGAAPGDPNPANNTAEDSDFVIGF